MYLKLIAAGVAAAAIGSAGYWGGLQHAGHKEERRVEACAAGIKDSNYARCPTPILDALSTLQLRSSQLEVVYRDRTIPVIVEGQTAQRELATRQAEDVATLATEERTRACADSPAMRRRREQLFRDEGPAPSAADTPADPPAG